MNTIKYYLFCVLMLLASTKHYAQDNWVLEGTEIMGSDGENLGTSVSLSTDGTILAMGAPSANSLAGLVRVYQLSGGVWSQMGSDILGGAGDSFGFSISLSADGNTLAIGANTSDDGFDAFSNAGYVKIYEWNGSAWVQKGSTLSASEASENFGNSVSLSADGEVIAVGAPGHNGLGSFLGAVRVYEWSGSAWAKIGSDIVGTADFESFGTRVSLAITGTDSILVASSPAYESAPGNFDNAGRVGIFRFSEGSWGGTWASPQYLEGNAYDEFGGSLDLSGDGARLIVGAPKNFLGSEFFGYANVYEYVSTAWQLMDQAIVSKDGNGNPIELDGFAKAVAISEDGSKVVIGAPSNVTTLNPNGRAEVYTWSGSAWDMAADSIPGTSENEEAGAALAVSGDGGLIIVASPLFDAQAKGMVRAFKLSLPDTEGPTVTIQSEKSVVNNSPFLVYFSFSEPVVGLIAEDVMVVNGSPSTLQYYPEAIFPNSYSVDVTPDGNGNISIQIPAAVVQDGSGNDNVASETIVVNLDIVQPMAFIQGIPSGAATFNVSIIFNEPVIDFVEADITVLNASLSNFQGSDSSYTADITPQGGDIVISLAANVTTDAVGNGNALVEVSFDQTGPIGVISTTVSDTTNAKPFPVTIAFNELVSGFAPEDISVMNGSASNLQTEDSITFTADVLANADGFVSVFVEAAKLVDIFGNANTASDTLSVFIETTRPTVYIFNDTVSATNGTIFPAFIVASEKVSGLILEEILVENGTASDLTGPFAWVGTSYVYVANITANGVDSVRISIDEGVMEDQFGNSNLVSNIMSAAFDSESPIAQIIGTPVGQEPFTISIIFNEPVVGFVAGDVLVTGATLGNFQGQDSLYTADITPSGAGDITVSISANVARDAADNFNLESTASFDQTAPTVILISTTVTDSTNVNPFPVSITFNEVVSGFASEDISVINGEASNLQTADSITFTADVLANADGLVNVFVEEAKLVDISGNANAASDTISVFIDTTRPTVFIFNDTVSVTNGIPFPAFIVASEKVSGLILEEILVENGTASDLTGPFAWVGTSYVYVANITANGVDSVRISIDEGVMEDQFGNSNIVSNIMSAAFDAEAPIVQIMGLPNGQEPFNISIIFNEPVFGFTQGDLLVTGATLGNFQGQDSLYSAEITPSGAGDISVSIGANVARDEADNFNLSAEASFDQTSPIVALSTTVSDSSNVNPFPVTITFNEVVSGFIAEDISAINGVASNLQTTDSITFTVDVLANADGLVSVFVEEAKLADISGNTNSASDTLSVFIETTRPTVFIFNDTVSSTNTTPFPAFIVASEKVSGLQLEEILVENGTASNLTGPSPFFSSYVYVADITADGLGAVKISILEDAMEDVFGNGNQASNVMNAAFDDESPLAQIFGNPVGQQAFTINIGFNEAVVGFEASDITISGATLSNFSGTGAEYSALVTPLGGVDVNITIPENALRDAADNYNSSIQKLFDITLPTVILSTTVSDSTNIGAFPLTITFSEEVTGFSQELLYSSNVSLTNFATSDNITFTADISALQDGQIKLYLAEGLVADARGNGNLASDSLIILVDRVAPDAMIDTDNKLYTNGDPFPVAIGFSETVYGLEVADVSITNASISEFTGPVDLFGFKLYLTTVTPDLQGDVVIGFPINKVVDKGGNGNTMATSVTVKFDMVAPTPVLSYQGPDSTNLSEIELMVSFEEEVKNFETTDFQVTNVKEVSLFNQDGLTYRAVFIPETDGEVSIQLPASVLTDLGDNPSLESNTVTFVYDGTFPVVAISSQENDTTNAEEILVSLNFSEPIKDFTLGDITALNASAGNLVKVDNTNYTFKVVPINDGKIEVQLLAGVVNDGAGNGNMASAVFTIVYDKVKPTIGLTNLPKVTNGSPFMVNMSISERIIEAINPEDIQLTNATISEWTTPVYVFGAMLSSFKVNPDGNGHVSIAVNADIFKDQAGNFNNALAPVTITLDNVGPEVLIQAPASVVGSNPFEIQFVFNEKTIGFVSADVTLENATLAALTTTDSLSYTGMLSPQAGAALLKVSVLADKAQDLAGNGNKASAVKEIVVDVPPTVAILNAPAFANNTAFTITVKFSESVTGFVLGDITLSNATASNLQGTGDTYTASITPNGQGNISISIAAAAAKDAGGNDNTASAIVNITYDGVAPTLTITGAPTNVVRIIEPITLTFTFSEDVMSFTLDDIAVSNATKANFTRTSASVYTATITPINEGSFTASVAANAATDAAGNGNNAESVSMTYDKKYSGGTGTATDPYLIANEADLRELSASTDDHTAHFKQTADIKMSAIGFIPIGYNISFQGTYDGDWHVIDGLTNFDLPPTSLLVSLFNRLEGGAIKNLGVTSIKINGLFVAGLVGQSRNCTILNCYVTGEIIGGTAGSVGLVYTSQGGTVIRNSFTDLKITSGVSSSLIGNSSSDDVISNSYSLSNLVSTGGSNLDARGTLIGYIPSSTSNTQIENSYFAGTTQYDNEPYNGIVAAFGDNHTVTNSFWDKELSGIERTDGGGTPLTTTQMKTLKTFTDAGWDFNNTWYFPNNYPVLKWQVDRMKEFTISGKVVDENGNAFTAGSITAYGFGGTSKTVSLDAQGKYKLDLPKGFHTLYVTPNNADAYLITCYGNTNNFFKSKIIFYNHSAVDFKMIAKSQTNLLDGNGRVSGKVVSTANGGGRIVQGAIMDGDPLAGVSVMLIRVSDEQVMTTVVTDENGDFTIEGIPAGEYRLVVYIAGIATDLGDNTLNFTEEATTVEVTALVSEEGVTITIDRILGLEDGIEVNFYPNPAYDHVNIQAPGKVTVKVINLAGVTLIEKSFVDNMVLDVSSLKAGVHLIEISNAKGTTVRKLMKGN